LLKENLTIRRHVLFESQEIFDEKALGFFQESLKAKLLYRLYTNYFKDGVKTDPLRTIGHLIP